MENNHIPVLETAKKQEVLKSVPRDFRHEPAKETKIRRKKLDEIKRWDDGAGKLDSSPKIGALTMVGLSEDGLWIDFKCDCGKMVRKRSSRLRWELETGRGLGCSKKCSGFLRRKKPKDVPMGFYTIWKRLKADEKISDDIAPFAEKHLQEWLLTQAGGRHSSWDGSKFIQYAFRALIDGVELDANAIGERLSLSKGRVYELYKLGRLEKRLKEIDGVKEVLFIGQPKLKPLIVGKKKTPKTKKRASFAARRRRNRKFWWAVENGFLPRPD